MIKPFCSGILLKSKTAKIRTDILAKKTLAKLPIRIIKEFGLVEMAKEVNDKRFDKK